MVKTFLIVKYALGTPPIKQCYVHAFEFYSLGLSLLQAREKVHLYLEMGLNALEFN
jgi:hypothetical protein